MRANKNHEGTPFVLHREDSAMSSLSHVLIAAGHSKACRPLPNIARATVVQFLEPPPMVANWQRDTQYRRIQQDDGQQLLHDCRLALHP